MNINQPALSFAANSIKQYTLHGELTCHVQVFFYRFKLNQLSATRVFLCLSSSRARIICSMQNHIYTATNPSEIFEIMNLQITLYFLLMQQAL